MSNILVNPTIILRQIKPNRKNRKIFLWREENKEMQIINVLSLASMESWDAF